MESDTALTRRAKRFVPVVCGVVALILFLAVPIGLLQTVESTVDKLVRIMTSSNRADAAWAFTKLEEADGGSLGVLFQYVNGNQKTSLHLLSWGYGRKSGRTVTGGAPEAFTVGEMARFVLAAHLEMPMDRPVDVRELERAWGNAEATRETLGFFGRLRQLFADDVTPPSKVSYQPGLGGTSTVDSLVHRLTSADRPEAVWALEALRSLPDGAYQRLFSHINNHETTKVTSLAFPGGVTTGPNSGHTVSQLLRYLICYRLGSRELSVWQESVASAATLADLRSAWKER